MKEKNNTDTPDNGNIVSPEDANEVTTRIFEDLDIERENSIVELPAGARTTGSDSDDDEMEYVKPDERFKQKRPEHEVIRERLQQERDRERKFNQRQKFLNYFTRSFEDKKMGFFKLVYNLAYAGGFLFNLFTVVIMGTIIFYITYSLIFGGMDDYFSLARAGVGIVLIVVMNYIHGQIRP